MFANTQTAETCLGPALKAAYQVIQHVGGKLHVFTATRPTVGESPIKNREGAPAAAKPKEGTPTQLQPDGEFYKNLAVDCSKQQVCVDIWSFAGAYTDLATIGQLAKHTTGSVYHYPSFSDAVEGEKLSRDLQHNLTREQGWEAVMRVRASRGLRISSFLGHFFIRGTDLLALPNVDEDKAFAVEIAHEENAQNVSNCCLQAALLYTTSDGERRIRVHTMQVPASAAVATLFESADVDACANVLARLAADQAVKSKLLDGAEKMQTSCMEPLRAFRAICPPQAKAANAVLLPELLKLLPLYALGLMKTAVFSTAAEVRADDRMALIYELATMGCERSVALMHPRLFQLFPPPATPPPLPLPLTALSLNAAAAYLLDDGISLTLWLGHAVPTEFLQGAFGWGTLDGVDASALRLLPADSSPTARQIDELVSLLRSERPHSWLRVRVMKQGDGDAPFLRCLVEDQTKQMMSYGDFVMHCHRYVLSKAP